MNVGGWKKVNKNLGLGGEGMQGKGSSREGGLSGSGLKMKRGGVISSDNHVLDKMRGRNLIMKTCSVCERSRSGDSYLFIPETINIHTYT